MELGRERNPHLAGPNRFYLYDLHRALYPLASSGLHESVERISGLQLFLGRRRVSVLGPYPVRRHSLMLFYHGIRRDASFRPGPLLKKQKT